MATAKFNGQVIAKSDDTVVLEGNHYFPADALTDSYFTRTPHTSVCPWKGTAHYYTVTVDGKSSENAAWYYPEPKDAAKQIAGRVAFWKGVVVTA